MCFVARKNVQVGAKDMVLKNEEPFEEEFFQKVFDVVSPTKPAKSPAVSPSSGPEEPTMLPAGNLHEGAAVKVEELRKKEKFRVQKKKLKTVKCGIGSGECGVQTTFEEKQDM